MTEVLDRSPALYLARRDAYAAFLAAADAEANVAWFRNDGRYAGEAAAVAAVDAAYAATRAAYCVIEVEGVRPAAEARALVEQLAALHKDGGASPDWKSVKEARTAFADAARTTLRAMRTPA